MTIEASPSPQTSHRAAAGAASHGARAKAGAAAPDAAGTGAGFLAILGALGDAPSEAPALDLAGADTLPADASTGAAAIGLPTPAPFDANTLLQQNPQIAAAQVQQAAASAAATTTVTSTGTGRLLPPGSAAGSAPPLPSAATSGNALGTGTGTGTGTGVAFLAMPLSAPAQGRMVLPGDVPAPAPGTATSATATAKAGDATGKAAAVLQAAAGKVAASAGDTPDVQGSSTQGLQQAFARAKAGLDVQAGADNGLAAGSSPAAAGERAEPNKLLAAMEQARAASGPSTVDPVLAPLVLKQEKSQTERERSGFDTRHTEPTYSGSTVGSSSADVSQSGAPAPVLAPEMQVAEQVRYWVSHNVQNAELSLDGLGQSPVQVSISLQGNEAQISFRTDEVAARDVLQNAGAHLKDMLQREGLVLTGVTVGSSGSGNTDGGERRPRQNARQALIAPLQASSVDTRPKLRTATLGGAGRSVDLFV